MLNRNRYLFNMRYNTFESAQKPTSSLMGKYRDIPTTVMNKKTRVPTISTVTKYDTGTASL